MSHWNNTEEYDKHAKRSADWKKKKSSKKSSKSFEYDYDDGPKHRRTSKPKNDYIDWDDSEDWS